MDNALRLANNQSGRAGEGRRVEQEAIIYSDRSDWRVEAQPQTDRMSHSAKANITYLTEDVAKIVKRYEP